MKKVTDFLQEETGNWFEDNVVANAPLIVALFANFVVIVADVRVYDVVYRLTGSSWKALSSSLACAVPFLMWEIAWQYNHTSDNWRTTSLAMAGLAFATSIFLGVADFLNFSGEFWTNFLLASVVVLTGVHTIVGFLYYYNDPDVARKRRKSQALAKMEDNKINAEVADALLKQGSSLLEKVSTLESQYSIEEVEAIMAILQGRKQKTKQQSQQQNQKPKQFQQKPVQQFASDTESPKPLNPPRAGNDS